MFVVLSSILQVILKKVSIDKNFLLTNISMEAISTINLFLFKSGRECMVYYLSLL